MSKNAIIKGIKKKKKEEKDDCYSEERTFRKDSVFPRIIIDI